MSVLVVLATVTGCRHDDPDFRYRLRIQVQTPEGARTGSSVIAVNLLRTGPNAVPLPNAAAPRIRGEAAMVEMPDGQILFALLRSKPSADWAGWIMLWMTPTPSGVDDQLGARFRTMLARREEITVPREFPAGLGPDPDHRGAWPLLVRFGDLSDPRSVQILDPDHLDRYFGAGVRLLRITVQRTDDPPTFDIGKTLPWLGRFPEPALDSNHGPYDWSAPAILTHGDFIRRDAE